MSDIITYEHPLNERIRTFLRLELLFKQTEHFLPLEDVWSTRAAVTGLLDIVAVFARSDLKTEILKELDRHNANLSKIKQQSGVDMEALGQILDTLEDSTSVIFKQTGQIGKRLRTNDFLSSIAQRSSLPGGTCSFDLPQYHAWLREPHAQRHQQLTNWLGDLDPIRNAIGLILSLTRTSSRGKTCTATKGIYQQSLDANVPAQLVRVSMAQESNYFPEISGNKHRFNIRFLDYSDFEKITPSQDNIEFELTCCII